jgi:hypothetical protein
MEVCGEPDTPAVLIAEKEQPVLRRMSGMKNPNVKDDLSVDQFNTTFRFCVIFLSCA